MKITWTGTAIMCLFHLLLANHAEAQHTSELKVESRKHQDLLVEKVFRKTSTFLRDNEEASKAPSYEWSGVFDTVTPERIYVWSAQRVNGEYADATMKLVVLSAPNATAEALEDLKPKGQLVFGQRCRPAQYHLIKAGATITPDEDKCYMLEFDPDAWQTLFKVSTASSPHTAFFTEHAPTEFESTDHYFKDISGADVDPGAEASAEEAEAPPAPAATPWGTAIGAAIAINIVTLSGVISMIPAVSALSRLYKNEFAVLVAAFAAGGLLSCAFNVLLFEASHLIATGGFQDKAEVTWRWGAMILAGFLTSTIIDCAISFVAKEPHPDHALPAAVALADPDSRPPPTTVTAGTDPAAPVVALTATLYAPPQKDPEAAGRPAAAADAPPLRERARLIGGVLVRDFCHNLCDGIFVGAAFNVCGGAFGWSVASATVIHEVAQELSDYTILVSPTQGGLHPLAALALNSSFLSGLSVVIGAIIVLAAQVSDLSTGLILAFGGGVYIHVGATECMPRVYRLPVAPAVRLLALFSFVLGTVAIALVLLSHEHCDTVSPGAAAADPHAGHNH